ncbi:MAG: DUF4037 domain-containing protein [Ruminococcaceae bacterium]|nr:DUF4037 domain-containing protein [Oscillospiraceae bacterium]
MKGLEICRSFYNEFGAPMLHEQFPEYEGLIAVGLVGSGSECYGFDDEISKDHDFEAGFCMFLPDEDIIDRQTAFQLERAYSKLPKEYMGLKRSILSPAGGNRHGVIRMSDFYTEKVGSPTGDLSSAEWLTIDEFYLSEATNGEIFRDDCGAFTLIRNKILNMPEDIRLKKLAGNLIVMAQAGQYNFKRCLDHGEQGAAQLAVVKFAEAGMRTVFLLNRAYMPYYKWSFRMLRTLPLLSSLADSFEFLITSDNSLQTAETKYFIIEDIASMIIDELQKEEITKAVCGDLEKHAYSVNDFIKDSEIRNLNIFSAV